MNKFRKIYLPILITVTVIACVLSVVLRIVIAGKSLDNLAGSPAEETALEPFSSIDAEADIVGIRIISGSEYKVSYGKMSGVVPEFEVKDGVLRVTTSSSEGLSFGHLSFHFQPFSFGSHTITIEVPEDAELDSVSMVSDSGDFVMEGLTAEKVSVEMDAGNIDITDCSIQEADIDADAGDVGISGSEFGQMGVTANLGAGNLEISESSMQNISIEASAGNVEISGSEFEQADVTSNLGNITTTDSSFGKSSFSVDAGNIELDGDFSDVTATCDVGNIEITNRNSSDDAKYDLRSDIGKITVNGAEVGNKYVK